MLKIQNIVQLPLVLLGIMMIIPSNSQASSLSDSSNSQSSLSGSSNFQASSLSDSSLSGSFNFQASSSSGSSNSQASSLSDSSSSDSFNFQASSSSGSSNSQASSSSGLSEAVSRLSKSRSALLQSRDGFLNQVGNRKEPTTPSVSFLNDVSPGEWNYQSLGGLMKHYSCVDGYPDGTWRGDRILSRDELAGGINHCLDSIQNFAANNWGILRGDIEKTKLIIKEFEGELTSLGARTHNLESRAAFLENHQSSVTTIFSGEMIMGLTGITNGEKNQGTKEIFKVTNIGHRGRLKFNTTFDGDDSLYIRFTTGTAPNYADITDTFEGKLSFTHPDESDLAIQLIIYSFALAENVRMFVEPVGGAFDDFVPTLNFLDGDAASGALSAFGTRNPLYYMPGGPGVGFRGQIFEVFEWSGGYLAKNGASPHLGSGMFNGPYGVMGQLAYQPNDDFKVAFTYLHGHNNLDSGTGSSRANPDYFFNREFGSSIDTSNNSYRVEFTWHALNNIIVGGWGGFTTTRTLGAIDLGKDLDPVGRGQMDIWNWSANVSIVDTFVEGDTIGFIFGMEPWVSKSTLKLPNGLRNNDRDTSFHGEIIYEYPINDNISITPGVIFITAPDFDNSNNPLIIGTLRTTFTF